MISFDPDTGLSAQDTAAIRAAIVADWENIFDDETATLNSDPESPAGQIIDSMAVLITAKDAELLELANQFNPATADGRFQDALAKIYFITRKVAEPTVVNCQCIGLQNTVIPAGAIIQNTDGYRLKSLGAATIPASGTANVEFACEQTGPIEIGANTCTEIVTIIPGWDTVNNSVAGALGRDAESRAEFEYRRHASVANNAHGSVAALYGTLANLPGVLDLQILENRGSSAATFWGVSVPGHSVAVCIYGGLNAAIAEALYNKLGNGCGTTGGTSISHVTPEGVAYTYEILRPSTTAFKVRVTIRRTASTSATIVTDVQTALMNDFYGNDPNSGNGRVGLAQTVYASRFSVAAIKTAGVADLVSIEVALGSGSYASYVDIPANREPVLSATDIDVVIEDS